MQCLRLAPLALAAALTACGGGNDTLIEPSVPDADAADSSADPAAAEKGKALAAFDATVEKYKDLPVTEIDRKALCVPGESGCVSAPAGGFAMAGIDLIAATADPAATQPGGRAWLSQAVAPQGGTLAGSTDTPDFDTWRHAGKDAGAAPSASLVQAQAAGDVTASFTSGSFVVNPMSGQNPRRVKIFLNYRIAATGEVKNGACSGTLVDSQWVITNSHCLWNAKYDRNGYVRVAYIAPGYADNKAPYGRAYATEMLVPEAYKTSNDIATDVAWFKLDRPIGGLTGFDGLSAIGSLSSTPHLPQSRCNEGLTRSYINQSYPADKNFTVPGQSAPVNGEKMYQTNFKFDQCLGGGSAFVLNHPIGHGASGSAGFETFPITKKNVISSLYESSDQKTYARFVALTPQHTDAFYLSSAYQNGVLTSTQPDLAVASFRVTTPTKDSEPDTETSPTTSFNVNEEVSFVTWIHNNAFVADFNGPIRYRVYISSDPTITFIDQQVAIIDSSGSKFIRHKGTEVVVGKARIPCVKVPKSTSGEYYMGVRLEVPDGVKTNNATIGLGATAKVRLTHCN